MTLPLYVQGAWFAGALLFILGLKGMSSPATARRGIIWAGYGMLLAIAGTFLVPGLKNLALMALALGIGAANAAGGYVVTERMLAMFKKKEAA